MTYTQILESIQREAREGVGGLRERLAGDRRRVRREDAPGRRSYEVPNNAVAQGLEAERLAIEAISLRRLHERIVE